MSRTEKTFFRQALLKRMLLDADSLSRAEQQHHTGDPEPSGRCSRRRSATSRPFTCFTKEARSPAPPTLPPQLPPPNHNTWHMSTFTGHLLRQKGGSKRKETVILFKNLPSGGQITIQYGNRPQLIFLAFSLTTPLLQHLRLQLR